MGLAAPAGRGRPGRQRLHAGCATSSRRVGWGVRGHVAQWRPQTRGLFGCGGLELRPFPTHTCFRRPEIQPAASPLQSPRPARDGGPLPHGRVEVEPHRTPPVLRNQQERGGTPAGQLRDHPEIPAHHTHGGRAARASASGQEGLQDRHQGRRRTNAGTTHHRGQRLAEVELHHRTHRTHVAKMGSSAESVGRTEGW